jgi:hypothetical protein
VADKNFMEGSMRLEAIARIEDLKAGETVMVTFPGNAIEEGSAIARKVDLVVVQLAGQQIVRVSLNRIFRKVGK